MNIYGEIIENVIVIWHAIIKIANTIITNKNNNRFDIIKQNVMLMLIDQG